MSKRILGQTNLWLNRRKRFNRTLLIVALKRIAALKPDLLLLSGDLTTTSLEDEFADIAALLEPLTDKLPIVAVPGNHDRYTFGSSRVRRMEHLLPTVVPQTFPHYRKLSDRWHLLALDGAKPNLFSARGRVGDKQLRRSQDLIKNLTSNDGLVVLCHYPIKAPPRALPITWDHKLADSRQLRQLLLHCPARVLYVHGHIHKPWLWQPKRKGQQHLIYLNTGAPCMVSTKHPLGQGFWEVNLPLDPIHPIQAFHHVPHPANRANSTEHNHLQSLANKRPVEFKSTQILQQDDLWRAHQVM